MGRSAEHFPNESQFLLARAAVAASVQVGWEELLAGSQLCCVQNIKCTKNICKQEHTGSSNATEFL